jgi:hypothetical protein
VATIDELIASIEVELEAAHKRRDKAIAEAKAILSLASQEGRANLTAEEDERVAQLFVARDGAKADADGIQRKLANATKIKAEELENHRAAQESTPTPNANRMPAYDQVARVGQEERTYHRGNDRKGGAFIRDLTRNFLYNDVQAGTRLARHMAEERVERAQYLERAVGTGAFAGLTVPQYLTDMYAPATAALRPFADICNKHDLPPDGMTVNISRITTASGVALQSAENAAVQETNLDDTLLTENVQTAAGQQTISRQAIDRGTGVEDVVMDDLFRRYATTLDATLITQATTGLAAVATGVTYDDTSPTVPEFYPKIFGALSGVESALLGFAQPTHAIMHSRRWYWMQAAVGSNWPAIQQPGFDPQTMGSNDASAYNSGRRGVLPNGLQVICDNNVQTNLGTGTNQDEVYIVPSAECHLWEDPQAPVFIRAEQAAAANLGVLLVLYGYFAYSFRRYSNGMGKVTGTGLVTPSF